MATASGGTVAGGTGGLTSGGASGYAWTEESRAGGSGHSQQEVETPIEVTNRIRSEVLADVYQTIFGTFTFTAALFGGLGTIASAAVGLWLFAGFFALGTGFFTYSYSQRGVLFQ